MEIDHPNNDIYKFEGTLILPDDTKTNVNINNILLRVIY
jgi:hypothetical protein